MTYAHLPYSERLELYARLKARYGEARADAIMTGRDPEANKDLDSWRTLGQPKREGAA